MNATLKALLLIVALAMSFPVAAQAQSDLNQVRLAAPVTSDAARTITLTVADSVAVGDVVFIDQEAMVAQAVNTTTDIVTVARGAMGTAASEHLDDAIAWTGTANRFYFSDPKAGRCTANSAYPGGAQPWINVLTGDVWYCNDNLFGRSNAVAGNWQSTRLYPSMPGVLPYTPIAYRTSRNANNGVVTPAYSVKLTDVLIASLTYSGPFEIFLPNPTGLLGKIIYISDFAGLNTHGGPLGTGTGATAGRTITIRGLFENGDNTKSLARWEASIGLTTEQLAGAFASTSYYVGITSSSIYYWFSGWN